MVLDTSSLVAQCSYIYTVALLGSCDPPALGNLYFMKRVYATVGSCLCDLHICGKTLISLLLDGLLGVPLVTCWHSVFLVRFLLFLGLRCYSAAAKCVQLI